MRRLLLSFGLLAFCLPSAHAQSFDCDAARTPVELAICSNARLAALDESLADTYRTYLGSLAPEHQEAARELQRLWLRSRDRNCDQSNPNGIEYCLGEAYEEWLIYGQSGVLFVQVPLESGESHTSPLVDSWRFEYQEEDVGVSNGGRQFHASLGLHIDGSRYQLAVTNDNGVATEIDYDLELPNSIGYFLTNTGVSHVGYVMHTRSDGGTCGYYDRRDFVFLDRHGDSPVEYHRMNLSYASECAGGSGRIRSVQVGDDGTLDFLTLKGGPSRVGNLVAFVEPHITRVHAGESTVEEFIRVDPSTTHFEGELYDDLIDRTAARFQVQESRGENAALNDCGVPVFSTRNYLSLKHGTILSSLTQEGRPFGFEQLQHFVFNVLQAQHLEQVQHYQPLIDGTLRYLDGMRELEDWESRLDDAAKQYSSRGYPNMEMNAPTPFIEAGFPTDPCFSGLNSSWDGVDLEQWIYLFWARRLRADNLEVTERMMRHISSMLE